MAQRSIAEIRKLFPNPRVPVGPIPPKGYCVGGAVCCAHGYARPFPTARQLTETLGDLNPKLSRGKAEDYAIHIIVLNDLGHFEDAWDVAAKALGEPNVVL